jgi:hypothetical protein
LKSEKNIFAFCSTVALGFISAFLHVRACAARCSVLPPARSPGCTPRMHRSLAPRSAARPAPATGPHALSRLCRALICFAPPARSSGCTPPTSASIPRFRCLGTRPLALFCVAPLARRQPQFRSFFFAHWGPSSRSLPSCTRSLPAAPRSTTHPHASLARAAQRRATSRLPG